MLKIRPSSIRRILVLFLAAAFLSQSSLAGAAGVSLQPSVASPRAADPGEVWSIVWTSTKTASGSEDNSSYHYVESYNYVNSGSTLYRKYADGTSDNADFLLHVADDFDSTTIDVCTDNWGHPVGYAPSHIHAFTTGTDRYNNAPYGVWSVFPAQNADDSWWMLLNYDLIPGYYFDTIIHENG